jgi:glycerophosphoryl diester phosphodiesterase
MHFNILAFGGLILAMTVAAQAADRPFDIEAHRGGRALRPENTLQSFANALTIGVDTLELDMGVTKDGFVIVSHDRHLSPDIARDAGGNYVPPPGIPFVKLTLKEVQSYDVGQIRPGSDYAKGFPDQTPIPGTRIPTLSQVFDLVRRSGNPNVRLNIETKLSPDEPEDAPDPERFVAVVMELLRKESFTDRVTIQSFDWRTLQLVQKQAPAIPTAYLTMQSGVFSNVSLNKPSHWTAGFDPMRYGFSLPRAIKAAGGAIWSPFYRDLTPALVQEAHGLGLKVLPWTVNDPKTMAELIDMSVDGIISDRPDLLRQVAGEKGIALPVPTPVSP